MAEDQIELELESNVETEVEVDSPEGGCCRGPRPF